MIKFLTKKMQDENLSDIHIHDKVINRSIQIIRNSYSLHINIEMNI